MRQSDRPSKPGNTARSPEGAHRAPGRSQGAGGRSKGVVHTSAQGGDMLRHVRMDAPIRSPKQTRKYDAQSGGRSQVAGGAIKGRGACSGCGAQMRKSGRGNKPIAQRHHPGTVIGGAHAPAQGHRCAQRCPISRSRRFSAGSFCSAAFCRLHVPLSSSALCRAVANARIRPASTLHTRRS